MPEAAIGIGSNVGDRLGNVRAAVKELSRRAGRIAAASDVFETPPWGLEAQPRFLNACAVVDTPLAPHELLQTLKEIEQALGRKKRERWGPREIDLDILLYEGISLREERLTLPHPHMHERAFVLVPLAQIAPRFVHATSGKTVAALLDDLPQNEIRQVVRIVGI